MGGKFSPQSAGVKYAPKARLPAGFFLRAKYPLSLAALASSPKGTPFVVVGNFAATPKAVPLGKVASP